MESWNSCGILKTDSMEIQYQLAQKIIWRYLKHSRKPNSFASVLKNNFDIFVSNSSLEQFLGLFLVNLWDTCQKLLRNRVQQTYCHEDFVKFV